MDLVPPHRPARREDAAALAELANIAGEGLPWYVWSTLAEPGQSPWDVGRARAARDEGAFSWRNAIVREEEGQVVAALAGYPLEDPPPPVDYDAMPPPFVPLQRLEDRVPGTWYVNLLATRSAWRRRGCARALLAIAEDIARETEKRAMSIIVADTNEPARKLYSSIGYREIAREKMVKGDWVYPGTEWVLMVKELEQA